jgi:hypothetical protein
LREGDRKPRGLGLKRDRDWLALQVSVSGSIAIVGVFVSTALERKTYRNGKK